MKYLITESQIDKLIFKYLNNQDFIVTGNDTSLFFVNSENDEYAQIRYDEDDEICFINVNLVTEISSFFSLQLYNSQQIIGKWVENTIQMKVINAIGTLTSKPTSLRIPSN